MTRTRTSLAAALLLSAAALPLFAVAPAAAASGVLPWDFNDDGKADLAVGAPAENVGSVVDAGTVSVFMADPITGAFSSKSVVWTQDSPGVAGIVESDDQFGWAMTSGDFNGDGVADLAISANKEDVGGGSATKVNSGFVTVLFGVSGSGLTGLGSVGLEFNPNGFVSANTYAGDALASGDMNGDGIDELAVGGPGLENVRVYNGSATAFGTSWTTFSEATTDVPGTKHLGTSTNGGDLFGESLAMGDFNNDTLADLVVGIPYDYDDENYSVGAMLVVPGRSGVAPLDFANSVWRSPESDGIQGVAHPFGSDSPDSFGRILVTGDFNSDDYDDIAVGIPGVPLARTSGGKVYEDAGRVQIFYGGAAGIDIQDKLITQETSGVYGESEAGDMFGASLDAGQRASSPIELLAIGSTEERVVVLQGGTGTGSAVFSQDTTDVPGNLEVGDGFAAFVRFLDNTGSGSESLIVSAPGENDSSGAVFILPSTGTIPTGTGATSLTEDSPNAVGTKENGDNWGWLGDSH